jgi:DNA-directed RNA polymerase subunit RPC12/RpoP
MTIGKCPKCARELTSINIQQVDLVDGEKHLRGGMFVCPHCSTVINVSLDPRLVASALHRASKRRT